MEKNIEIVPKSFECEYVIDFEGLKTNDYVQYSDRIQESHIHKHTDTREHFMQSPNKSL